MRVLVELWVAVALCIRNPECWTNSSQTHQRRLVVLLNTGSLSACVTSCRGEQEVESGLLVLKRQRRSRVLVVIQAVLLPDWLHCLLAVAGALSLVDAPPPATPPPGHAHLIYHSD